MAKKRGIVSLVRQAGREVKQKQAQKAVHSKAQIHDILSYIEQPWGLNMNLYPAQRFIVKLYYNLPLDQTVPRDVNRRIRVTDMFGEKVLYTFSEHEYLSYLYNEGRCNIGEQDHDRRELVLAVGRRAGKCLKKGSVVLTDKGFFEIQDLGDVSGPEYQPLQIGVAQEGAGRSTSAFFYNGGKRDTVRIRSRCGYEVEGTPNHRVRVIGEDGVIQWRALEDVKVGDFLGVHRKTDLWPSDLVFVGQQKQAVAGDGLKSVCLPDFLDEHWGSLLGILVGDGTWTIKGTLEVTVGPYPEWLALVQGIFKKVLGTSKTKHPHNRASRVLFHSIEVRNFLDLLGYSLKVESHSKHIPWVILRSPKSVVAAFLRGLFETDGSVERGGRVVSFSTASAKLASDVQLLLLNFGIVSRVKPRWNKRFKKWYQHMSVLGADSVRLFAEQIGFLSKRKTSLLQAHITKGNLGNKSATEAIPHQRLWCRRLLESVPRNNGNAACGKLGWRRSLLRTALGNVIKNSTESLSYPRLRVAVQVAREVGADSEVLAHFEGLLEAGYFYDKVVETTSGHDQVYDLTVPEGQAFVANGLTNHNTALSGIFASYEVYKLLNLYNPQAYYGLPNGNRIQIISVATDKDQAGLLFNEVTTHLAKCDYFSPYICNNTLGWVNFRTPYDIEKYGPTSRHVDGRFVSFNGKSTLRVTFKSCIAKGLRGAGNVVIILDEVAHFQDKGGSSAAEIYDAVTPSAAAFSRKNPKTGMPAFDKETGKVAEVESRIILISSPLGKTGKFYEKFDLAMHGGEGSENILAIQAPTWEINPTVPPSYYREKYHSDPRVFMVEHGALFSDQTRGWIERKEDLLACIDPNLRPIHRARPKVPHQIGIDVGLVGDGTAVAITHIENERIILDYHELWKAGMDWRESNPHLHGQYSTDYAKMLATVERLDFDEIADWIVSLCKRFHITRGLFDRWNGIPLEQTLHKRGYKQFEAQFFTRDMSSKIYQSAKMFMFDERLVLYDYPIPDRSAEDGKHSPLILELFALQAKQVSKNIVLVEAPKKRNAHDDVSDALIRSIWLSMEAMLNQKHAAHGGIHRPYAASGSMTPQRYQVRRARTHGGGVRNPNVRGQGSVLGGIRGR